MKRFYLIFAFIAAILHLGWESVQAQYFAGNPGTPIYGPPLSDAELSGKVVYIEYWGIHCGPCRAAFPHLVECQNQYGRTGCFALIGSHLQEMSPEVTAFLQSANCNFTNYQQYHCPLAPPADGGIPQAYLLDCRGQLIAGGHPNDVLAQVGPAVADAMQRSKLLNGFNPMQNLDIPQAFQKLAPQFSAGKSWGAPLAQLEKKAKKSEEAKVLLDGIQAAIDAELESLAAQRGEKPGETLYHLTILSKSLKGLPQMKKVESMGKKLEKLEGAKEMQKMWGQISAFQKKARTGKISSAAAAKETKKILKTLNEAAENTEFHDSVRAEASALAEKFQK